jgi:hypothetical protein
LEAPSFRNYNETIRLALAASEAFEDGSPSSFYVEGRRKQKMARLPRMVIAAKVKGAPVKRVERGLSAVFIKRASNLSTISSCNGRRWFHSKLPLESKTTMTFPLIPAK